MAVDCASTPRMIVPQFETVFQELARSLGTERAPLLKKDRPIYIYGAGGIGKDVAKILRAHGRSPVAFLDRNARPDSTCENLPVLQADSGTITPGQRKDAQVIIGVFNRDADSPAIAAHVTSLGYGRVISFLEFHDAFHAEMGDRFWLTDRRFYADKQAVLAEADLLWSDAASRDLYRSILKVRLTLDPAAWPTNCQSDQYFPGDIPPWTSPLRFADCGAYDGDTLRFLATREPKLPVEAVAAFEPDQVNYEKLAAFCQSGELSVADTTCLFPCGVGEKNEKIHFAEGSGESSRISDVGNTVIQCVTLDSALVGFHPNLIKMDIEGSEMAALEGARQILLESRPGLAICVYHQADHLWRIPLLIQQLLGGRHYLRIHAHNALELVYYWQP